MVDGTSGESVQLSKLKSVDLIDVSSGGGVSHQQIPLGPNTKCLLLPKELKEAEF
jgi:hypothetical protein